jgi:cysteine-rich repeat protein
MKINLINVLVAGCMLTALCTVTTTAQADPRKRSAKLTAAEVTQVCGNFIREGREECDDGNLVNGDRCNKNCEIEVVAAPPRDTKVREMTVGRIRTDKIRAGQIITPYLNVEGANIKDMNVTQQNVARLKVAGDLQVDGDIIVNGSKGPVHDFGLDVNFASGLGRHGIYSVQVRGHYGLLFPVDKKGTRVGFAFELGVGGWGVYDASGYCPTSAPRDGAFQIMIPMAAFFEVGNDHGGGMFGLEGWALGPLINDQEWRYMSMVRIGGWIDLPGKKGQVHSGRIKLWAGTPVHIPFWDGYSPFATPSVMVGVAFGYNFRKFPDDE